MRNVRMAAARWVAGAAPSLVLTALVALSLGAAEAAAQEADLTGTWNLEVVTGQGSGNPTMVLEQNGNTITGTYESALLGNAEVSGTLEGNEFTISFTVNAQGQSAPVTYTGTVEGDSMSGQFDLAGMAGGPFTGTRAEE